MKRKHVATGKPRGGKREGSGRPEGAKSSLEYGEVQAVKAAGLRVPEGAPKEHRELADRALQRITDVMEERVFYQSAGPVLKAATVLREEICGAVKQRVEHSMDSQTDEQLKARLDALLSKAIPQGAGPTESAVPTEGADLGPEGEP